MRRARASSAAASSRRPSRKAWGGRRAAGRPFPTALGGVPPRRSSRLGARRASARAEAAPGLAGERGGLAQLDAGAREAVAAWARLGDFWASAALFHGLFRPTKALRGMLDAALGELLAKAPRPRIAVRPRRGT